MTSSQPLNQHFKPWFYFLQVTIRACTSALSTRNRAERIWRTLPPWNWRPIRIQITGFCAVWLCCVISSRSTNQSATRILSVKYAVKSTVYNYMTLFKVQFTFNYEWRLHIVIILSWVYCPTNQKVCDNVLLFYLYKFFFSSDIYFLFANI